MSSSCPKGTKLQTEFKVDAGMGYCGTVTDGTLDGRVKWAAPVGSTACSADGDCKGAGEACNTVTGKCTTCPEVVCASAFPNEAYKVTATDKTSQKPTACQKLGGTVQCSLP